MLARVWRKGDSRTLLEEMEIDVIHLYGGSIKNWKYKLLCDPAIPLMGIYRKKLKTLIWKCAPQQYLHTITKIWKQPKCLSIDKWIKEKWYTHTGILLSHKTEWNSAICNNIDEPGRYYTWWNKSETQILYIFTSMESNKIKYNKKETHRIREQISSNQRGVK